jgi:hypothetical protein
MSALSAGRVDCVSNAPIANFGAILPEEARSGGARREHAAMSSHARAGLSVVKALFPGRSAAIDRLASCNEDFRDICADVADLSNAISAIDTLDPQIRQDRLLEFQDCLGSLMGELERTLAKIAILRPRSSQEEG